MATARPFSFGELLRRHRLAAGLTLDDLAERAGLSAKGIGALERGERHAPHRQTVSLLADALHLLPTERAGLEAAARQHAARLLSRLPPQALNITAGASALVGRAHEQAVLERHLAGEGPPLLLLAGEPGIGKTRLLQETIRRGSQRGMTVLQGGCRPGSRDESYAPVLQALRAFIDRQPRHQLRRLLREARWLVRLLPELLELADAPLPLGALEARQERRLMFDAVRRYLAHTCGPGGVLMSLDDLQWASSDGLALLSSLVVSAEQVSLRLVGSYRDTEVETAEEWSELITDLSRDGLVRVLQLSALTRDEALTLAAHLCGGDLTLDVRGDLVRRSGGVPFFLVSSVELARTVAESDVRTEKTPWNVTQSIRQRVLRLDHGTQEMLAVASIVEGTVPDWLLTAILDEPEAEVARALDAACRAGLLATDGAGAYRFAHDLVRETVLADIGLARRAHLHRKVGQNLEQRAAPASQLAWHFVQGNDREKALHYGLEAGHDAARLFAHAEAKRHFGTARQLAHALMHRRWEAEALEGIADATWMQGEYVAALEALGDARTAYRDVHDPEGEARVVAQMGRTHHKLSSMAEGADLLREALASLTALPGSRAVLLAVLARLLFSMGNNTESLIVAEEAAGLASQVGDLRTLAEAELRRGTALGLLGRLQEASEGLVQAVELAEARGELDTLRIARNNLAVMLNHLGRLEAARTQARLAVRDADILAEPALQVAQRGTLAECEAALGNWMEARRLLEEALRLRPAEGGTWFISSALTPFGALCLVEGQLDEAARYLEEGLAEARQSGNPYTAAEGIAHLAELDVLQGRPDQALARIEASGEEIPGSTSLLPTVKAVALLGVDRVAEAEAMVTKGSERARADGNRLMLVEWLRVQGLIGCAHRDRWGQSAAALEESLELARTMQYPYAEAKALYVYGQLLATNGQPEQARERLEAALAICDQLGEGLYRPLAQRALDALQEAYT